MITEIENTVLVEFAKDDNSGTVAVGHTDKAFLYIQQLSPPPREVYSDLDVKKIMDDKNPVYHFGFKDITDVNAMISALKEIKDTIQLSLEIKATLSYFHDTLKGQTMLIVRGNKLFIMPVKKNHSITIYSDAAPDYGKNPKTIFSFTTPKSIDTVICILNRIKAMMTERESCFAMAC